MLNILIPMRASGVSVTMACWMPEKSREAYTNMLSPEYQDLYFNRGFSVRQDIPSGSLD